MSKHTIVDIEDLAEDVTLFEVEAPEIAGLHQAGQFVMVRPHPESDRLPLAVAWTDDRLGTITLVVRRGGKITDAMRRDFRKGDRFSAVLGPFGHPTPLAVPGREEGIPGSVVVVASGMGAASIVPIAKAFRRKGHEVLAILGASAPGRLLLAEWLAASATGMTVVTEEGSFGRKGSEAEALRELVLERRGSGRPLDLVIAVGPPAMMKDCAEVTRPFGIPTLVSLTAVLFDGSGGCGACPVLVGGEVRYACVDGPELDGHTIDFDPLIRRAEESRRSAEALEREKLELREASRARTIAAGRAAGPELPCQSPATAGELPRPGPEERPK